MQMHPTGGENSAILTQGNIERPNKIMTSEKVLIVDDEKLVRWSLRQKCQEWGYQVSEAESGTDGLRMAQNETPDLVLLDVRLQDMNGLEVLQKLKQAGDAR